MKLLLSDVISPGNQAGGGMAGLKITEPQFLAFIFLPATLLLANFIVGNITFFTHLKENNSRKAKIQVKFNLCLYQFVGTFVDTLSGKNNMPSEYIYWSTAWTHSVESYSQGFLGLSHACTVTRKLHLPVPNDSVHLKQNYFPPQVTSNGVMYCP